MGDSLAANGLAKIKEGRPGGVDSAAEELNIEAHLSIPQRPCSFEDPCDWDQEREETRFSAQLIDFERRFKGRMRA